MSRSAQRLLVATVAIAAVLALIVGFAVNSARAPDVGRAARAAVPDMAPPAPQIPDRDEAERLEAESMAEASTDTPATLERVQAASVSSPWQWDRQARPVACTISGLVVDPSGQPVAKAEVRTPWFIEYTRADGSFEAGVYPPTLAMVRAEHTLIARRDGFAPALVENFGARVLQSGAGTVFERIVLREQLSISGRVIDCDGRGVPRGRVRIVDGTPLDPQDATARTIEPPSRAFDTTSGFEIGGLLPRDYVLEFELHQPLTTFRTAPIPAGSNGLEITVPSEALLESVHGYLITSDGSSLAGATLDVALQFAPNVWWPKRSQVGGMAPTKTDRGGGFELRDIPSAGASIVVDHPLVPQQALPLAGFDLKREITLVARRRARLQLEKFDEAYSELMLDLLDPTGAPTLWETSPGAAAPFTGAPIAFDRGRSKPVTSLEGKFTLIVRNGPASEILRREIELFPDRTTIVTP